MGHSTPRINPTAAESSRAPWMEVALEELSKGIHELKPDDFRHQLSAFLAASHPKGPTLLDWRKLDKDLVNQTNKIDAVIMRASNPSIASYLGSVRTDPDMDPKHRSFHLDTIRQTNSGWRMTAWCAAFVNWCLSQVDAPHLGYATAISWVKFGLPLVHPQYGCVVAIKPGHATSSTTGHVAFYGRTEGDRILHWGGNQHQSVSWMHTKRTHVLGFRWPATIRDFPISKRVSSLT